MEKTFLGKHSKLVATLAERLLAQKHMLVTAESCTGGEIAAVLTSLPGSSNYFERGFVTYTNAAKQEMLGVSANLIEKKGAVSEEVAHAMAEGALLHSHADVSLAVTGIAGPGGGSAEKPVGLVWFAWASEFFPTVAMRQQFGGDRSSVREQAVIYALEKLLILLT